MMTQTERDREDLIKYMLQAARNYRHSNGLFEEDPVRLTVPPGQWHLITSRDVEFLKVFNIHLDHLTKETK